MTRDTAVATGQNRSRGSFGRWWPLLAVVGLLGLAAVAASLSEPRVSQVDPAELDRPGGGNPEPPPPSQELVTDPGPAAAPDVIPSWLTTLLTALCVGAGVAVVGTALWILLRNTVRSRAGALAADPGDPAPIATRSEEVVAAVNAGLEALSDTDRDPRRAVIACWVRLEQAAAAAGTPREVGDTPTDLVLRLLGAHRVDRRVLDAFAAIYRAARYATHEVDENMRAQAVSALRQLRTELTMPVGGAQ